MQEVVSAMVGTTARGRPRYSGCNCCSTDAKKLFRSMCRKLNRSGWRVSDKGLFERLYFAFYLPSITSYVMLNGSRKYNEFLSSRRIVQPFSKRNFRAAPMSLTVKLGIGGCVFRSRFTQRRKRPVSYSSCASDLVNRLNFI